MAISVLSSKGQTTIPKSIRELLQIGPNDRISFIPMDDGSVRIVPVKSSAKALKGFFKDPKRVTLEQMKLAVRKKRVERARRS
ncbi:MAG: type II toxin-antitoxin system PrlF family antitoxin [Deltaproteobacteria bacterium]|nr:type II toxin-antitoxin system PrlF family antitoxin [Deltaproteobacteria bacterium]